MTVDDQPGEWMRQEGVSIVAQPGGEGIFQLRRWRRGVSSLSIRSVNALTPCTPRSRGVQGVSIGMLGLAQRTTIPAKSAGSPRRATENAVKAR